MTLRPTTAPQRVPLPSPLASSLLNGPDPESDSLRAARPTVTLFLATVITDPSFESTAASALVSELVEFATASPLDYATSLVVESEYASVFPPSVGGECALGTDVLEDRQEESECFAATVPHLVSMLLASEGDLDAPDISTPRSYAETPASPLPGPYPYSGPTRGLTERREPDSHPPLPESRPASLESCPGSPVRAVCTGRRVPHQRPPPVPGTHFMTLRPTTAPQRVPLPSPLASSLLNGPDPESDSLRAARPTVTLFLATVITDPSFESTAASALVSELVEFATASPLDYATSLVVESEYASVFPPSVGGECALGTDVLEDRQEESECFAATVPHLVSMLLASEGDLDAPDISTPRSYAETVRI
ncbi:unnamed protein product [Closterium sp. NIES-54]